MISSARARQSRVSNGGETSMTLNDGVEVTWAPSRNGSCGGQLYVHEYRVAMSNVEFAPFTDAFIRARRAEPTCARTKPGTRRGSTRTDRDPRRSRRRCAHPRVF